jgi:hypothetical protein
MKINYYRQTYFIFFCLFLISNSAMSQGKCIISKISFENFAFEKDKENAIQHIDSCLRQYGNLNAYGDLSKGVNDLLKLNYMTITNKDGYYYLSIAPDSGSGHDFGMKIDKNDLKLHDVVVGEVTPYIEEEMPKEKKSK